MALVANESKGLLSSLMRSASGRPQSYARQFSLKDIPVVEEPKFVQEETKEEEMKPVEEKPPKSIITDVMAPESWVICSLPFLDFNQPAAAAKAVEGEKKKKKKKKVKGDKAAA
jgi:hypothetical protein